LKYLSYTRVSLILVVALFVASCQPTLSEKSSKKIISENWDQISKFYSNNGTETQAQFSAVFKTSQYSLEQIQKMDQSSKDYFERSVIKPTIKYLFGPLTENSIGGMRTEMSVKASWELAYEENDQVFIPYFYTGTWLVTAKIAAVGELSLPLPFNESELYSEKWLACTDSDPEHQTESFFWYFWDPNRFGCDHKLNVHYQLIDVKFKAATKMTVETYPDYQKMIQSAGIENTFQMTFAFGYVTDVADSNPDTDSDYGMDQYRKFIRFMDMEAKKLKLSKSPILQSQYLNPQHPLKKIGYRYSGLVNDVQVDLKVVTSANIDQMELFAKSYAHDHDSFFSWFGHSRVGSGFDADNFASMLRYNPDYYSLSTNYQMIYWAGCNSYSYYAQPFFKQKAKLSAQAGLQNDPAGYQNLDIIANGLPSLFSFNADNAIIVYNALINWQNPTSYQTIVNRLEKRAASSYYTVLVNILGDEDNNN